MFICLETYPNQPMIMVQKIHNQALFEVTKIRKVFVPL